VAKFRGLHVVAGIAAMLVAAWLGSAMKLNNTAVVMSSCVVFVAVAMWVDSALTRRRRRESLTLQQAASMEQATSLEPASTLEPSPLETGRETDPSHHQDITHHSATDHRPGNPAKREGNAA
jgi:glucose-6-phosphate-specific signal transduction histidine kinase